MSEGEVLPSEGEMRVSDGEVVARRKPAARNVQAAAQSQEESLSEGELRL